MFSIWPFRPQPSRLEQVKNTLGDVVDGAERAIHEVAESASEAFHSATKAVVPAVASSVSGVVETTSDMAHGLSQKAGNVSEAVAKSTSGLFKNIKTRGADAAENTQEAVAKSAQSAAKIAASQTLRAKKGWDAARETSSTRAHDFAQNVAETSGELKKNAAQKAAHLAHNTAKTAQQTTENLGEHAHAAQQNMASSLSALAAAVLAARANVGEHFNHHSDEAKDNAGRFSLPVSLPEVHLPKIELPKVALLNVSQATSQLGSKLQDTKQNSARRARDAATRFANEPSYEDLRLRVEKLSQEKTGGDSRFLWLAFGILGGVILALLLAPNSGRRSRAALRDKIGKAGRGAKSLGKSAARKKADLGNRIEGKLHERASQKTEDDADDITVADRVRTALGEHEATRNLERINVDCADGLVTLRGPIVEGELQAQIETVVRSVRGVRDVRSDLLISDAPEDAQTFVG